MRIFLFITFVSFLTIGFSQTECKEGHFSFGYKKNTEIIRIRNFTKGEVWSSTGFKLLIRYFYNSSNGKYSLKENNDTSFTIIDNEENTSVDISISMIKTKAYLSICSDSLKSQLQDFLDNKVNTVTIKSKRGIPFLTFTKI